MPATALDYIQYAECINAAAGSMLKLNCRPAMRETDGIKGKVSIGLSLQAAELAAKSILTSLGLTPSDLKSREFRDHAVLSMLERAETLLDISHDRRLHFFKGFLSTKIIIEGTEFEQTIKKFLAMHFSHGPFSNSRNYFYPDEAKFTSAEPFNAMHSAVVQLIDFANRIAEAKQTD